MNPALKAVLLAPRQRPPSSVLSLFSNGEVGGVWLPSFTKSMFQDSAMTIPAAVGMPVAKMLDLSGNNNTITFTNVTLQQDAGGKKYLALNGSSSKGVTGAINFSATSKLQLWTAFQRSGAATEFLVELGPAFDSNAGDFGLYTDGGNSIYTGCRGTAAATVNFPGTTKNQVVSAAFDLTGATLAANVQPRLNGSVPTTGTTAAGPAGGGTFGAAYALNFGCRNGASFFLNGGLYGVIARGAVCAAGQIVDVENYLNTLTLAY